MKPCSALVLLLATAVLTDAAQRRQPAVHGNAPHRARRAPRRSRAAAQHKIDAAPDTDAAGYNPDGVAGLSPGIPGDHDQGDNQGGFDGQQIDESNQGDQRDPYGPGVDAAVPADHGVDTYGGQGGGGENHYENHDENDAHHSPNNKIDGGFDRGEERGGRALTAGGTGGESAHNLLGEDNVGETCEVGDWTKYYCSCQKFLVKSRAVTNKETAYGCDELVKKSKKTCVKASSKCAARAYEVAIDTLDHVEASDNWSNAARSYRLAGGLGQSNTVVTCLSEARNAFEGVITGTKGKKKGSRLAAVNKAEAVMKKMLPKADHEAMITALTPYFDSTEHHADGGDPLDHADHDTYGNQAGAAAGDAYGNNGPAGHDAYGANGHQGAAQEDAYGQANDVNAALPGVHDVAGGDSFEDGAHSPQVGGDAYGGHDGGLSAGTAETAGHTAGTPHGDGTTDGDDETHGAAHPRDGHRNRGGPQKLGAHFSDGHVTDTDDESPPHPLGGAARHDAYDEGEEYDEEGNPINGAAGARGNILVGGVLEVPTEHTHAAEISRHSKSSRGDIFFFLVALALLVGVVVVALSTACQNPWLVLLASSMDFWVMTTFYWIDVRLPYNIDHYAEAGLIYDAFAITCVLVLLFAAGRSAVAMNHMMARTRSAAWQKLELLTVLGLFAQLTVLCIHVVTTKHASRTTVAGFIGTILSTVVQTWHLMQQFAERHPQGALPSHSRGSKYGSAARSRRLLNYTRKAQAKQI